MTLISVDYRHNRFQKHLLYIISTLRRAGTVRDCYFHYTNVFDLFVLLLFSRELPFKKGDVLFVHRHVNDDWLEGEYQGMKGIFPLNHVELFPMNSIDHDTTHRQTNEHEAVGEAIVKYDFTPQKPFELQLRKVSRSHHSLFIC
jgi:hypothetical protein